MKRAAAEVLREYTFPGIQHVHGVSYDGRQVWFAAGETLKSFDPASGQALRSLDVAAHAGTAFDGQHLFQIAEDRIQRIDPATGQVLSTIPAPAVAVIPGSHGPRGRCGSESIVIGRSIRSIRRQGRSCARSNPTAS